MIECVFTLDYEVYGNGTGGLRHLVLDPAEGLARVFAAHGVRFVNFVEVAEFERIEEVASDDAIGAVVDQIRDLHAQGFETGLHMHPQWYNATFAAGRWELDYGEYSLCRLPTARIERLVDRGLAYLRRAVGDPDFTPVSFRAGNWLFQPTSRVAAVLASRGVKVDSSVFKGGLQRGHGLDYRPSLRNGDFWRFSSDVNTPAADGLMLEIPIHVEMAPFWRMATRKRVAISARPAGQAGAPGPTSRWRDFVRLRYPRKLDFCRMTLDELVSTMERVLRDDQVAPTRTRPVVAIGHTKDLVDLETVERFLGYLASRAIRVSTLADLYPRLAAGIPNQD